MDTHFVEKVFLPSWKEEEGESVDPKIISRLRQFFSVRQSPSSEDLAEKQFNPWQFFS